MKRNILIVASFFWLNGCSGGGSDVHGDEACKLGASDIQGCWITEQCGQMTDSENIPIELWGRNILAFESDGKLRLSGQQFSNSSCTGLATETVSESNAKFSYEAGGSKLVESGLTATRIVINVETPDAEPPSFSVDHFYNISSDGRLCFSEGIAVRYNSVRFSPVGGESIDFDNCLLRLPKM